MVQTNDQGNEICVGMYVFQSGFELNCPLDFFNVDLVESNSEAIFMLRAFSVDCINVKMTP